jgi:hypothetical protein
MGGARGGRGALAQTLVASRGLMLTVAPARGWTAGLCVPLSLSLALTSLSCGSLRSSLPSREGGCEIEGCEQGLPGSSLIAQGQTVQVYAIGTLLCRSTREPRRAGISFSLYFTRWKQAMPARNDGVSPALLRVHAERERERKRQQVLFLFVAFLHLLPPLFPHTHPP